MQLNSFGNFDKMAAVGHFGCPKFTLDRISGHFRSIQNFYFFGIFYKMAAGAHFGYPKFTFIAFLAISDRYSTLCLTKWLLSAILDVRNSLSIAFLAILDQ